MAAPELAHASAGSPGRARTLRAATWALRAQFFVAGALFATFGVHVPTIKTHYGLGEQLLATAMLAAGAGSVFALLQGGRVLARRAPRQLVPVLVLACVLALGNLLTTSSYLVLVALMLAYGMAAALMDVAINDEASSLESEAGRHLMSGFHAMFSLGGMAGAGAWSLLAAADVRPVVHLVAASVTLGLLAFAAARFMLASDRTQAAPGAALSLPRGPLALVGLLAAMGLIAEGAMYDWSVLYMRQDIGSPPGMASLGYASFSLAMAAGRFAGDWVRDRMAPVALLRASGALGMLGMGVALSMQHAWIVLAGFALTGLGFANIVPVLFSAAAKLPGTAPAHAIAAVASVGYFGMMVGPPLIGFIAQARTLTTGLMVVIVFAAMVTALSQRALGRVGRP
jgi:predicted MFS family arabinose efflux permease